MGLSYRSPRHAGVNGIFWLSTLLATSALWGSACGGDGDVEGGLQGKPDASTGDVVGDDSGPAKSPSFELEGCVVSVLATDCGGGLPVPHEVELLDAKTGVALPGFKTTSASGGKYSFKNVPGDVAIAIHALGVGPTTESGSTYDTVSFYVPNTGDNLLRVSSVGTAGLTGMAAGFTPADDRAALSGAVYQVDDSGRRIGAIGCAKIYLDDQPHPAPGLDQRYNASNGIPTALTKLDQTLAGAGRFYIGNLTKGEHKLRVSLDDGKTFIAERSVFLAMSRQEAASPFKSILYLMGIDVKGPNPTRADCPTEEKK